MLKIAEYNTITGEKVELKDLEKYGFVEYKKEYVRHYKNDIETCVDRETREIRDFDTDYRFTMIADLGESTRVNDLKKDGLVEKVEY